MTVEKMKKEVRDYLHSANAGDFRYMCNKNKIMPVDYLLGCFSEEICYAETKISAVKGHFGEESKQNALDQGFSSKEEEACIREYRSAISLVKTFRREANLLVSNWMGLKSHEDENTEAYEAACNRMWAEERKREAVNMYGIGATNDYY